ncbi:WS/DGAT domain-containing protein [Mycolicibacterium vaccae]|uniref:WS/DGAT domain-containing protein n=1 Tax=Mycolicibacterium vaccae TaxID=1810 RepID=UPI003CFDCC1C
MTVRRLAAVDAQFYWMSKVIPSDQFLIYAFDGGPADLGRALNEIRVRAQRCADLGVRIDDDAFWSYPAWTPRVVADDQIQVHELAQPQWQQCLDAVTALTEASLDTRDVTWRLHVFPHVEQIPGGAAGAVVILQISHALADGVRASALAAHLLGRAVDVSPVTGPVVSAAALPWRAVRAARTHRRLVWDTAAGLVPPQADSRPVLRSNTRPDGVRHLRTVRCSRERFGDTTVTVGALAAISEALAGHLRELGDDVSQLGAETPMAKSGPRAANNHFGNVGLSLFPERAHRARVQAIAADLYARRRRASHPAMQAEVAAFAAMPAPLLRWGVRQLDPAVRSSGVTGNTVVSSVNRGAKDLRFGGAAVVLTAGFPTLSPMMGVTHGVHGIGDTVVVSVHAADSAIGDVDAYLDRLARALAR